ncbi:porin [Paraburkholderia sartisoli]|uniref:Outer membrane protein (Porin) n=1 Tax=Paraburkholderia sartisoli TaxID=83784 RepID=A0A1H4F1U5_9BURK|nr:porin [Paraburkholderia sartisoli]SEA91223.1 Outer membrane protein (porin) [Paraburkholderia sartisoli]
MKSSNYGMLAITVIAASSNAMAQSSVTLYGTIDEAVAYFNNTGQGSVFELQGADLASNKWGLKGEEDLGGGLKTVFDLENGFDINTGAMSQGGREFGKQAYVGLSSDKLGTLTFGRQYDPTVDLVQGITADGYGPAFTTPGDADNNDNSIRVSNAIKYTSPTYAGFQYELLYALGGVAGNTSSGQTYSAAALYTNGGLSLAAGYLFAKNDGAGGSGTADQIQNNSVTPLDDAVALVGSRQIAQVAAQYVIAAFTVNARYSNAQYKPYISFGAFDRTEHFNIGAASLGYQATPAELLAIGYTYTKSSGASSATYHSVAASSQYSLSKRTTLYATAGYTHASGTTFSSDGTQIVPAGGAVGDLTSSSRTPSQVAVMIGLVHKF